MTANIRTPDRDPTAGLSLLTRALKEPTLRGVAGRLIERARPRTGPRKYSWSLACSGRSGHGSHDGGSQMQAARFPARNSLKAFDFDFDYARGLERDTIADPGTLGFVTAEGNVVFGPPGTSKTLLAIGSRSAPSRVSTARSPSSNSQNL